MTSIGFERLGVLRFPQAFLVLLCLLFTLPSLSGYQRISGLYVDTFGDPKDPAMIFIHGGPGHNSFDFQATTADTLAKQGRFVVVYDQRGQGRNETAPLQEFTYQQYADDLKSIIDHLQLEQPTLLAHSHGGAIAIEFDRKFPGVAGKIVLVSAPVNFWSTIESMVALCLERYQAAGTVAPAADIRSIFQILSRSTPPNQETVTALVSLFGDHGLRGCQLYKASNPTPLLNPRSTEEFLARDLKERPNRDLGPFANPFLALPGFLMNENYIRTDGRSHLKAQKGRFFAIYGSDDGLFRRTDLAAISELVNEPGQVRMFVIEGASHNIYSDRQADFLRILSQL